GHLAQRLVDPALPRRDARARRRAQRGAAPMARDETGTGPTRPLRDPRPHPTGGVPAVTPTPRQAQRRYVGLTALRWLPIGISAPITVLLMTARGLSPADIGAVIAAYGVVTLLLEL